MNSKNKILMKNQRFHDLYPQIIIIENLQEAYHLLNTKKTKKKSKKVDSKYSGRKNLNRHFGKSDNQLIKLEKCLIYKKSKDTNPKTKFKEELKPP